MSTRLALRSNAKSFGLIPQRHDLLVSVASTGCGAILFILIHAMTGRSAPLLAFLPAFVVTALYGQSVAGLLAVGLATAFLGAFWLGSAGWLIQAPLDAINLSLLAAVGVVIVVGFSRSKQALKALHESEHRFRVALQGSSIATWTCDHERRYNWIYNMPKGVDASALIGKRVGEANPSDHYPDFIAAVDRVWQSGRGERLPVTWTHAGVSRHYFVTLDPIKDEFGRVKGLIGASLDMSDLHAAQSETARARNELQAVADLMASGVALYGTDLRYRWASRRYLKWLGKTAAEVIGKPMPEVLGPTLFGIKRPYIERVLTGESVTFEHEVEPPSRHRSWVQITYTPSRDADGTIDGWVGVITDITERREAEEALREADRHKDEFLATLAHELRNPMSAIRYATQLLRADTPPGVLDKARAAIERQSEQMTHLLDGLLDVSRISRNLIELNCEDLELRTILQEAIEAARSQIEQGRHQLVVSMPPQPLWVHADPTRLLQIVGNLLNNAAKYTPPGGEVRVSLEPAGELACISVRDTGVGLSEEMLPRVFQMFAQVHRGLDVSASGVGIGLALAKRLTELHRGTIEARSEGLGRGAEFVVHLPRIADPAQQAPATEKVVRLFDGQPRVLVVEDNRDAADNLAQLLRLHGLQVHLAYEGSQALEIAERVRPSTIVLDIGLPDVSGTEVARSIRQASWGSGVKIIAVTGWGQQQDRLRTRNAGIDVHLVKPVNPDEILKLIHSDFQASQQGDPASLRHQGST